MRRERFPKSLKALRAKIPTGALIQARITLESGSIVEFEGLADRGGPFDKVLETMRRAGLAEAGQETKVSPSAAEHEGRS